VSDFVIGAGSNLGERCEYLAQGLTRVAQLPELQIAAVSRVFESEALGPAQPHYLNAAVRVASALTASELLAHLLAIETALGRVRVRRWGPRTLDLDLLWAERPVATAALRVPHPELCQRPFALAPLLDVAPELAPDYAAPLARLGGAPSVWGRLSLCAQRVACERLAAHPV